jgi:transposase
MTDPSAADPCRQFFLHPSRVAQRQYEALRCVFVGGCSQKDAAQRFGYCYDASRQLVHQFRTATLTGSPPPFLPPNAGAGRRDRLAAPPTP